MTALSTKHVVITGGVHGNELTGVYLCHKWSQKLNLIQRPSFKTTLLLANELAIKQCRRYIDHDLNRAFDLQKLAIAPSSKAPHETKLAYQINHHLGYKCSEHAPDIIFDIHNTTSNSGISFIFGQITPLMKKLMAYLTPLEPLLKFYYMPEPQPESTYLATIAPQDICVEVGPQTHGSLNAELFFKTEHIIYHALNFLEQYNLNPEQYHATTPIELYTHIKDLDYPRTSTDQINAMLAPSIINRDYHPLHPNQDLFINFDGEIIPNQLKQTYYPVFIGEQAYYEKGIAMSLTTKTIEQW